MPGTPPTSPNFGIPRPADGDVASFSSQVNAVIDGFDANAEKKGIRAAGSIPSGGPTLSSGMRYLLGGGVAATLPTGISTGAYIRAVADTTASGTSPVTITAGVGQKIYGLGLAAAGASSFKLGAPGAHVDLISFDGTNWWIEGGEQDSGWIAVVAGGGVSAAAYTRLRGNTVTGRGFMTVTSGTPSAVGFADITHRPQSNRSFPADHYNGSTYNVLAAELFSSTNGGGFVLRSGLAFATGDTLVIDNLSVPLLDV